MWEFRSPGGHPEIVTRAKGGVWSRALIRSAQHERQAEEIRGPNWAFLWGDESGTWNAGRMAWDLSIGRLRQTIGKWWPRALLTGSPRWGWLNEVFGINGPMPEKAWSTGYYPTWDPKIPGARGAFYVRASDTADNRTNDPGYRRFLERNYGPDFVEQELRGDFVAPTGALFPRFYPHIHVIPATLARKMFDSCERKVGGVDWGYSSLGALSAGGIDGDGRLIIAREWQGPEHTANMMARIALGWRENLGIQRWYMDPSDGDKCDSWEGRVEEGVAVPGAQRADNARQEGWDSLRNAMRLESALRHPVHGDKEPASWCYIADDCVHTIEAWRKLRLPPVKEGEEADETKQHGPKRLTHIADAERYMYFSEMRGWQAFGGLDVDI